MKNIDISTIFWPESQLKFGLEQLTSKTGILSRNCRLSTPPKITSFTNTENFESWILIISKNQGFEVIKNSFKLSEIKGALRDCKPGLLAFPKGDSWYFLIIIGGTNKKLLMLDVSGEEVSIPFSHPFYNYLVTLLIESDEDSKSALSFVKNCKFSDEEASKIIGRHQRNLGEKRLYPHLWAFDVSTDTSFLKQLKRQVGLKRIVLAIVAAALANYLFLLSWNVFGRVIANDKMDSGWLYAWIILLFSPLPFRFYSDYSFGVISTEFLSIFRRKVFSGFLNVELNKKVKAGESGLISSSIEASTVESSISQAGQLVVESLIGIFTIVTAIFIFSELAYFSLALIGYVAIIGVLAYFNLRHYFSLTESKASLTKRLFERFKSNKTTIVQEARGSQTEYVDRDLSTYLSHSKNFDTLTHYIDALTTHGWIFFGSLLLIPLILSATSSVGTVAVGCGLVLLAQSSLGLLGMGLDFITRALAAWNMLEPVLNSKESKKYDESEEFILSEPNDSGENVVSVTKGSFKYNEQANIILNGCTFNINSGDKYVLSGDSGSGKSTLARILAGDLRLSSGQMSLMNIDRSVWNVFQWRQKIVYVPQFHNNYVFAMTFIDNVSMGVSSDIKDSPEYFPFFSEVMSALKLDVLIEKMPEGYKQQLGDNGWTLSHGEKSRLYLARGILQRPEVLILDESLASIDPINKGFILDCIERFSNTCILIAHK